MFLEKFVDDKTHAMLLRELGNLKMEHKEKVKDFNQRFNRILNRFPTEMKPHDSITINYYTSASTISIVQFVKRTAKTTLAKNYEVEIVVEKNLLRLESL